MRYSVFQRTQIVLFFLAAQRRFGEFRLKWQAANPNLAIPSRSTVFKTVRKFSRLGNVMDAPRSGRRKSARNNVNIAAVRDAFNHLAGQNQEEWGAVGVRAVNFS